MRKLSQQLGLLTLKHNTVLIMLFGLCVAPLHSDLWDLGRMLHANTPAAFKASLFSLWVCCSPTVSMRITSACSTVYLYILSALQPGPMTAHPLRLCVFSGGLVVDTPVSVASVVELRGFAPGQRHSPHLPEITKSCQHAHTQLCTLHAYWWGGSLGAIL